MVLHYRLCDWFCIKLALLTAFCTSPLILNRSLNILSHSLTVSSLCSLPSILSIYVFFYLFIPLGILELYLVDE